MSRSALRILSAAAAFTLTLASACGGGDDSSPADGSDSGSGTDGTFDAGGDSSSSSDSGGDAAVRISSCGLPGTLQFTASGTTTVPGSPDAGTPDLSFIKLPDGFCVHYFANVGNAMHMQIAPGGEVFVASPTTADTYGGPNGTGSIVVLADDDKDGYAETPVTFLPSIASTYGIAFDSGFIYYQNAEKIMKRPYKTGDRAPTNPETQIADITYYESALHWSKPLDIASDGTIYVGNGGDQNETCPSGFHGGIVSLATAGGTEIVSGLRWPTDVRCAHGNCYATDEGKDFSESDQGRSRLIEIHQGDNWGFPCCAAKDTAFTGTGTPDCTGVAQETVSFALQDNPRGFDFEKGVWPAPWKGSAIVALVGAAGTGAGTRVVSVPADSSGNLGPASDTTDAGTGMTDLATGWDDGALSHGRPIDAKFSPDGRLFLANEETGDIVWIDHM